MGRPFQTFEEWYQADQRRRKNMAMWSDRQWPVYTRVCAHRTRAIDICDVCRCKWFSHTWEVMKAEPY